MNASTPPQEQEQEQQQQQAQALKPSYNFLQQNTHAQNEAYFQSAEYAEWCRLARINEPN